MAADDSGIRIEGLGFDYGDIEVVRSIDLQIEPGELFGLLGPNGAGKTTTLSLLATLLAPTRGDARVFGRSLMADPMGVRQVIGIAPQEVSVYSELSGRANVRFFGQLYGLSGRVLDESIDRVLEQVGLSSRADDLAQRYSGGMLRRLNLACALVHEPQALLLDEPTVGVDPQSRDKLLEVIRELAGRGTSILYTTHYMEEAERLCDRIAILDQGAVIASGTLPELLQIVGGGEVIEIHGDPRIDRTRFARVPGLLEVESIERGLRLHVRSVGAALAELGSALDAIQPEIDRVDVHPVDLERVFMHLTGRALRDP